MDLRAISCSHSIWVQSSSSSKQSRLHGSWRRNFQLKGRASFQHPFRTIREIHEGFSACLSSGLGSVEKDESASDNVRKGQPVRTLLIDNYDSYTYNLYQLISVINGAPPRVIRNDEMRWEDLRKMLLEESAFDNVVISPGPGSPTCARDIGVCLQVLNECVDIPILGVCLGHQALGYINGAKVVHAPEPVHGRLSEIQHVDCPIFDNIPSGRGSGFKVVRYHSLALDGDSLPEVLIPTAWTLDSCPSVSFGSPLLDQLEFSTATLDRHGSAIFDEKTIRAVQHTRGLEHVATNGQAQIIGRGHGDGWTFSPYGEIDTSNGGNMLHLQKSSYAANDGSISNCGGTVHKPEEKVIMAISHRERPHHGVQFHPESVATSFGKQIMENFHDITTAFWKKKGFTRNTKDNNLPRVNPPPQMTTKGATSSGHSENAPLRLYWEKVDKIASEAGGSEGIFCGLFGEGTAKDTFWLDSSLQPSGARFSYMGGKGGRLWKQMTYSMSDKYGSGQGLLKIESISFREERKLEDGFLEFLSQELESCTTIKADTDDLPFDFWGGYVGYLGYELKAECGAQGNKHKSKVPDACYFFVDQFIAVDHLTDDVYVVALYKESSVTQNINENGGGIGKDANTGIVNGVSWVNRHNDNKLKSLEKTSAQAWVKKMVEKLRVLAEGGIDMSIERRYSSRLASSSSFSLSTDNGDGHFIAAKSRKQYMEDVKACLEHIHNGESYELCLTTQLQKRVHRLDALGLYLTLRKMNPAPYAAWLNFGPSEVCICCSSPERFLRLDQAGILEAKPIKGTMPRGQSPTEDEALKRKLQHSEKDQAENLMIVDLLRNDLGRVCEPGSVYVPSLMAVESYATVHTMVSTVRGMKRPEATSIDCVRAAFPGGSMTGAPKLRSMELLDSLECGPRGVYSGSMGFFSVNCSFDLNIVIRTLVIHEGIASIGAGGAIVALSDPGDEYEEMLLKTKAPIRAVSQQEALTNLLSHDIESGSLPHAFSGLH